MSRLSPLDFQNDAVVEYIPLIAFGPRVLLKNITLVGLWSSVTAHYAIPVGPFLHYLTPSLPGKYLLVGVNECFLSKLSSGVLFDFSAAYPSALAKLGWGQNKGMVIIT